MRQPSRRIVVEQNPSILEDTKRRQTLQPKMNIEMVVIKAHSFACQMNLNFEMSFHNAEEPEINGYTERLFSVRKVVYSIESFM